MEMLRTTINRLEQDILRNANIIDGGYIIKNRHFNKKVAGINTRTVDQAPLYQSDTYLYFDIAEYSSYTE